LNRLPQINDLVTLKQGIGLGDLRGRKLKVVYVDKKRSMDNVDYYSIGCVRKDKRYVVTESDIKSITEGQEKVTFT
jgi:hypothetical protein